MIMIMKMDKDLNVKAFVRTFSLNYLGKTAAKFITGLAFVAALFLIFSFKKIFDETSKTTVTGL